MVGAGANGKSLAETDARKLDFFDTFLSFPMPGDGARDLTRARFHGLAPARAIRQVYRLH